MKKIIIAMAAIAAAFTMASCNKEQPVSPNENTTVGKSVITASIENDLTKTTLEGNDDEGYKVFWSAGDNLFVGDYWEEDWCAEYKLDNTSAGSSNGVFSWQDGNFFYSASEGGEKKYDEPIFEKNTSYEAFYPLDFFNINDDGTIEGGLTWKTKQTYSTTDRYIPMYAITECAKEGEANFNFTNLGGLLRLTVKGTEEIARITIQANEPMSGDVNLIEDAEGNMVAEIVGGYPFWKNEVTLNCSNDRVALTEAGTDFYISLPCYMNSKKENIGYSGVTITLANAKGETCVKKLSSSKNLVIERSKITTATFTASDFQAPSMPDRLVLSMAKGSWPFIENIVAAGDQKFEGDEYTYAYQSENGYAGQFKFRIHDSGTGYSTSDNEVIKFAGDDGYIKFPAIPGRVLQSVTLQTRNPDPGKSYAISETTSGKELAQGMVSSTDIVLTWYSDGVVKTKPNTSYYLRCLQSSSMYTKIEAVYVKELSPTPIAVPEEFTAVLDFSEAWPFENVVAAKASQAEASGTYDGEIYDFKYSEAATLKFQICKGKVNEYEYTHPSGTNPGSLNFSRIGTTGNYAENEGFVKLPAVPGRYLKEVKITANAMSHTIYICKSNQRATSGDGVLASFKTNEYADGAASSGELDADVNTPYYLFRDSSTREKYVKIEATYSTKI